MTEAQEIKEIARVSKFLIPFIPLFCLSRQCVVKSFSRDGALGHGAPRAVSCFPASSCISLCTWMTPQLSGCQPGGGPSGCKGGGVGRGSQWGEATSGHKYDCPQEPMASRLCRLPCTPPAIPQAEAASFIQPDLCLACTGALLTWHANELRRLTWNMGNDDFT